MDIKLIGSGNCIRNDHYNPFWELDLNIYYILLEITDNSYLGVLSILLSQIPNNNTHIHPFYFYSSFFNETRIFLSPHIHCILYIKFLLKNNFINVRSIICAKMFKSSMDIQPKKTYIISYVILIQIFLIFVCRTHMSHTKLTNAK